MTIGSYFNTVGSNSIINKLIDFSARAQKATKIYTWLSSGTSLLRHSWMMWLPFRSLMRTTTWRLRATLIEWIWVLYLWSVCCSFVSLKCRSGNKITTCLPTTGSFFEPLEYHAYWVRSLLNLEQQSHRRRCVSLDLRWYYWFRTNQS